MAYRPMFIFSDTERVGNAQVFATSEEAADSARARFISWTMPSGWDVEETNATVNYRYDPVLGDIRLGDGP